MCRLTGRKAIVHELDIDMNAVHCIWYTMIWCVCANNSEWQSGGERHNSSEISESFSATLVGVKNIDMYKVFL